MDLKVFGLRFSVSDLQLLIETRLSNIDTYEYLEPMDPTLA
jgi:hypothetical protein